LCHAILRDYLFLLWFYCHFLFNQRQYYYHTVNSSCRFISHPVKIEKLSPFLAWAFFIAYRRYLLSIAHKLLHTFLFYCSQNNE